MTGMGFILLFAIAVGLILLGFRLWKQARQVEQHLGLPPARVVYEDMGEGVTPKEALVSHRWRLAGKPDYLLSIGKHLIPVEVKTANLPSSGQPYPGHVLQLAAYCLLVEEVYGSRPPYGYIRYKDATVQVPYTDRLRHELLRTLEVMRRSAAAREVRRSHHDAWRCARCGLAYACGRERLL